MFCVGMKVLLLFHSLVIYRYSKTEDLAAGGPEMMSYTHLLIGNSLNYLIAFQCLEEIFCVSENNCAFRVRKRKLAVFRYVNRFIG